MNRIDLGGKRLPWMEDSACRGRYDIFDGVSAREIRDALHLCRRHCPVLAECHAAREALNPRGIVSGGMLYGGAGALAGKDKQVAASSCVDFCEPEKQRKIAGLRKEYRDRGTGCEREQVPGLRGVRRPAGHAAA
jgi:hypothetical protein